MAFFFSSANVGAPPYMLMARRRDDVSATGSELLRSTRPADKPPRPRPRPALTGVVGVEVDGSAANNLLPRALTLPAAAGRVGVVVVVVVVVAAAAVPLSSVEFLVLLSVASTLISGTLGLLASDAGGVGSCCT
jgi:hypothetical protein